jgi:uncharacterized protein YabN with tetrapyrrole methylase and pyrophosphatase domain
MRINEVEMTKANPDPDATAALPSMATLLSIMKALRTPGTGCPWDLEQDFDSIAPYTIEEAYEVADAIARKDLSALADELGDLLLQVVYHAELASELGAFEFADVVAGICSKMVRRHPHVFGDSRARSATVAKGFWEHVKNQEETSGREPKGALGHVPLGLPALTRAIKLQRKAAGLGFDWPSAGEVIEKIAEESREAAARRANAKFERRFAHIEKRLAEQGRSPSQSTLAEMDSLWNEAKRAEP